MSRRALVAALAVSLLAATTVGAARGPYTHTDLEKLELAGAGGGRLALSGKVDSPKARCAARRHVRAIRKRNGERHRLGTDDTNENGKFGIDAGGRPPRPGYYFAEAPEVHFKTSSGHRTTCLAARSARIAIE